MYNQKKSVLFISLNAYPCNVGGLEVFNYYLINSLKDKLDIEVLTFCSKLHIENVKINVLKKLVFKRISKVFSIFNFVFKNRKSIGTIYLSYAKSNWSYWLLFVFIKRFLGIDYVFTIHGGGLTKWKPKFAYKLFFNNAKHITGVSSRILNEYMNRSGLEIIYTPPLIPFKIESERNKYRNDWSIDRDELIVLYVGSLKPLKAVDSLIEALGHISKKELNKLKLKVLIAGDGIDRENLQNRVEELDLLDHVRFLGLVERERVHQLYNLADIYTICSEFEGLPISLLEAFANGIPSITSDAPGLHSISQDNRNTILFETRNSTQYAIKLEQLFKDNDLQKRLKNNANMYYEENFSYKDLLDVFLKILN